MLAQSSYGQISDALRAIAPWLGAVLLLVLALVAVSMLFRRWWLNQGEAASRPGFTLAQLRAMRDEGQLSPEEFDRAKALLAARDLAQGKGRQEVSDNSASRNYPD